jgi:uracil-DNA glycosylase
MATAERTLSGDGRPVRHDPARGGLRRPAGRNGGDTPPRSVGEHLPPAAGHPPKVTASAPMHPAELVPSDAGFDSARRAAEGCRACELWERATQTVFGEGDPSAPLALVGEQPGDQEDRIGQPFVGPAGRILDEALAAAGIDRERVFLTNAVKHFRWRPSGKRRLHERPNASHIRACRPWLDLELAMVRPRVVVALGAVAAQDLLGPDFRVTTGRGAVLDPVTPGGPRLLATIHPSAVLRMRSSEERASSRQMLADDLAIAARAADRA